MIQVNSSSEAGLRILPCKGLKSKVLKTVSRFECSVHTEPDLQGEKKNLPFLKKCVLCKWTTLKSKHQKLKLFGSQ